MLVLEYKVKAKKLQYLAIEEAIKTTQFIRSKCLRYWMDAPREAKIDRFVLNKYSTELRNEFKFVANLNSMAVKSSAERAWLAISRFYDNCKKKVSGKKGYPRFQHDNRSVEYKKSGWKLNPIKRRITITDKKGIGELKLLGKWDIQTYPVKSIKRVRLVRRADGYYCQFCICLAKSIADASWYLFRQWIEYFAGKFGKLAVAVAPHYTSQKCSNCGVIVKKSLSTRTHVCGCGCSLHRDENAAINILNLARQARDGQSQSNALWSRSHYASWRKPARANSDVDYRIPTPSGRGVSTVNTSLSVALSCDTDGRVYFNPQPRTRIRQSIKWSIN